MIMTNKPVKDVFKVFICSFCDFLVVGKYARCVYESIEDQKEKFKTLI